MQMQPVKHLLSSRDRVAKLPHSLWLLRLGTAKTLHLALRTCIRPTLELVCLIAMAETLSQVAKPLMWDKMTTLSSKISILPMAPTRASLSKSGSEICTRKNIEGNCYLPLQQQLDCKEFLQASPKMVEVWPTLRVAWLLKTRNSWSWRTRKLSLRRKPSGCFKMEINHNLRQLSLRLWASTWRDASRMEWTTWKTKRAKKKMFVGPKQTRIVLKLRSSERLTCLMQTKRGREAASLVFRTSTIEDCRHLWSAKTWAMSQSQDLSMCVHKLQRMKLKEIASTYLPKKDGLAPHFQIGTIVATAKDRWLTRVQLSVAPSLTRLRSWNQVALTWAKLAWLV